MELLEMHGIVKSFPGVLANDRVDLFVRKGEIHALLGENGAGKSTLMNILYGLYIPEEGEVYWEGKRVAFTTPEEAIRNGIGMVHQHFMLVQKMTVLQNIILGLKPKGHPLLNVASVAAEIRELSEKYGLSVDPDAVVQTLSVGQQQRVEILKALYRGARLLILDEPTAVLTPQETTEFFKMLRTLRDEGQSVILISHRLSEIMQVSDRVTILRDGRSIGTVETVNTTLEELSRLMIGRELRTGGMDLPQADYEAAPLMEVKNLTLAGKDKKNRLEDITLNLYPGEVLGIAGVDGNGQRELAEVLACIEKSSEGQIVFRGDNIDNLGIRQRNRLGIAYIPDDRHRDGLVTNATLQDNLMLRLYNQSPYAHRGLLQFRQIEESSQQAVEHYNIKTPSISAVVRFLSGGNQQKIILARELEQNPSLVIACQPTRGLDIGASEYVRDRLVDCCREGGSVLLISTDLEEIRMMSHRIAVMYGGKVMGIVENNEDLKLETIGLMMGGKRLEEVDA
ncbi:MAG: ABC transporter ATP-binding protein [Oscillospiraceae bacterium]|nr:ABC transporter ATP-binding protein [Oscillospiraceae bacterium]